MDTPEVPITNRTDSPSRLFTIAVIGSSGTGKSTFIKHLTSDPTIHISSTSLTLCTTRVSAHPIPNSSITLLDTPAADSSLSHLLASLRPFTAKELPDGIIYLHRITDIGVCGDHLRDLCQLQTLVPAPSLMVATSLWDADADGPQYEEQVKREEKLLVQPELFLPLMEKGAMYERFYGDLESAGRIVARFKRRGRGREEQDLERAAERQAEEILVMNGSQNESESPRAPPTEPIAVTMATTSDDGAAPAISATSASEEGIARRNNVTIPEEAIADPPPPYTPYPTTPVLQNAQYNTFPPGFIPPPLSPSSSRSINGYVYCVSSRSWRPVSRRHGSVNTAPNGQHAALQSPPPPLPPRPPTNSVDGAEDHHSPRLWIPASSSAGPVSPQYHPQSAPPAMTHQPFAPQSPIQRRPCIAIKSSGTFRAAKCAVALPKLNRTPNIHPAAHYVPVAPTASQYPQENGISTSNGAATPHTGTGSFVTQHHSQSALEPVGGRGRGF